MTHASPSMPSRTVLKAANVNPDTGLATDYLNVFNEYIMLAELVADGSMEPEILSEWQPVDYESHFVQSNFAGTAIVLQAYRAMDSAVRLAFEEAINGLIDLILAHQNHVRISSTRIEDIKEQRDQVAAFITKPFADNDIDNEHTQAAIDAMFD